MEDVKSDKKRKVVDPVMVRVELVNGMFDLDQETKENMNKIRAIIERADREIADVFVKVKTVPEDPKAPIVYEDKVPHDKGRMLSALDDMQIVKNKLIDSLLFKKAQAKSA